MTELKFRTDTPTAYFDKSKNMTVMLTADFTVRADTDDERCRNYIPLYAMMSLNDVFGEYGRTVPYEELEYRYSEISDIVSDKLAEKLGCPCRAELTALSTDEKTAKLLEQMRLAVKMKDPAFAAAEMERAMQKARETAEKNGISLRDIQNMPMPEMPTLPDDPLERAKAIAANAKKLEQMAMNGSFAAPPAPDTLPTEEEKQRIIGGMLSDDRSYKSDCVPQGMGMMDPGMMQIHRPRFCGSCGTKLPESGNFCPNCGVRIGYL